MFSPAEIELLKHALDSTQVQGVKAAALVISAYHKLELAQQEPDDSPAANQPSPDKSAGE